VIFIVIFSDSVPTVGECANCFCNNYSMGAL